MAGLVTVTTPVAGTPISSSLYGIPVAGDIPILAQPPLAKMRNSTTQSIATATVTALTWDTEDYDTVGGHSTSSNTSRYTCQTGYAGYYRLNGTVWWAGSAAGSYRRCLFSVNGSTVAGSCNSEPPVAGIISVISSTIVFLNVGDYVECDAQQDSGGALSTTGTGSTQSWFEVQWIHS